MSIPFFSDLDMQGNSIMNIKPPATNNDLVNKEYVDISCSNLNTNIMNTVNTIESDLSTSIENIQSNVSNLESNIPNMIINSIVDDLNTPVNNKSLSAKQGYILYSTITGMSSDIELLQNKVSNLYENKLTTSPTISGSYLDYEKYQFVKFIDINSASSGFVTIDIFEDIPEIDYSTDVEIIDIKGTYEDNTITLGYKRKLMYTDTVNTSNISKDISIGLISNNRSVDLLFGGYWIQEGTVDLTIKLTIEYYVIPPENP